MERPVTVDEREAAGGCFVCRHFHGRYNGDALLCDDPRHVHCPNLPAGAHTANASQARTTRPRMGTEKSKILESRSEVSLHGLVYCESKSKWIFRFSDKPGFQYDRGISVRVTMTMIRGGHYSETVMDPATGEVLHHQSEPLANHIGHGDAKRREGGETK